jgi:hypothetical protein
MDPQVNLNEKKEVEKNQQHIINWNAMPEVPEQLPEMEELLEILAEAQQEFQQIVAVVKTIHEDMLRPKLPEWLNGEEVCRYLRISRRTLQNYRANSIVHFSQLGGKLYYKRDEVMRLPGKRN